MTVTNENDIEYAPNLFLDQYQPTAPPIKGLIINLHGGGWFQGDKAKEADVADWLAKQGYLVIVPNYRLAPASHFPAPLEDMDLLYQWLQQSFPNLPKAAIGGSAGGNLAVELGLKYDLPAISLSGILDIDQWLQAHEQVVATDDHVAASATASQSIDQDGTDDPFYKWFILNYLSEQQAHAATPYHHVRSSSGPLLLINSLTEFVPVSGVIQLSQRYIQLGIPVETILLPGHRHAKGYWADVKNSILAFLARYLTVKS